MNQIYKQATMPSATLARYLSKGRYQYDEDGELEKRCSRCKEFLPADSEFFGAQKSNPDGLRGHCKCCDSERKRLAAEGQKQLLNGNQLGQLPIIKQIPIFSKGEHHAR